MTKQGLIILWLLLILLLTMLWLLPKPSSAEVGSGWNLKPLPVKRTPMPIYTWIPGLVKSTPAPIYEWWGTATKSTATVTATPTATNTPTPTPTHRELINPPLEARQMFDLVNAYRVENGLHALKFDARLTRAAQTYAEYLSTVDCLGHECGSNLIQRAEQAGYLAWLRLGENLAAGQSTVEWAMRDLKNSPGHNSLMLHPWMRDLGVGYVYVPGRSWQWWWIQAFGCEGEGCY